MSNSPNKNKMAVTAGLRGASWNPSRMAVAFQSQPFPLVTDDGQAVMGMLYSRNASRKVVFIMHPRELVLSHYLVPEVLDAGWSCWVQGPRSIGNDLRLEHEFAVHDVAAGMRHLQKQGFTTIVLLGNSGGAGLFALYHQQSMLAPERRIAKTPAGRPTRLDTAILPIADGIALVSPHPGQGILLMNALDPSVVDEADPFASDTALDPFDADNGFRRPPESSSYSQAFIERYRQAQQQRVQRIDQHALQIIAQRQAARGRLKNQPTREDRQIAAHGSIFQVWRTDADLRCWDLSLDPSERLVGSLWGADPEVSNLGSVGFARTVTPESWLSTWSGLSSNASLTKTAHAIEQPLLLIEYTGDNCVFPGDVNQIYADIPSSNKRRYKVRGNHHGQALEEGEEPGQSIAGAHLQQWLNDTF